LLFNDYKNEFIKLKCCYRIVAAQLIYQVFL